MDSFGSSQLDALARTAQEITSTIIAENAEADDENARWPRENMQALGEAGLLGLNVPESLGGHGAGLSGIVAVSEIIARESPSTALCFAMHCVGTAVIAAKATKDQEERYLKPIARGEHITTLALSEPGTGSYLYVPQAELRDLGEELEVRGVKSFVTNGGEADSYVVSTVGVEEAHGEGTFSCVLIDEGADGLQWQEEWRGFGMRSNSSRTAELEGVRVPRTNLLGEPGDQLWYIFEVVAPSFLIAMAGTYIGLATGAVEIARRHVGTRRHTHSGETLGSNPVVAHRLGEMWIEQERARQFVLSAARLGDDGGDDALMSILGSKVVAADAAVRLTNEAMTLCGGAAYRENSRLARMLRDARASHVMAPTTDLLKTWTGRALVGLPLI